MITAIKEKDKILVGASLCDGSVDMSEKDLALAENIPEDMKRIKLPVLILHGSSDPVVPVKYSQQASQLFPNASLILIRDAEHGFFGPQTDEAFSYLTDFITTCLN